MKNVYFFEVTDVFSGEANYTWIRRYKVHAKTMRGAIIMVNRYEGFQRLKKVLDSGELTRWDVVGACICIFGEEWDESKDSYTVRTLGLP